MASDPNVQALRGIPMWGKYIYDAFQGVQKQLHNVSVQTNASLSGHGNAAPPQLNALHVDGGAGVYHAYITDSNQNLYRGAEYTAYYSENSDLSDAHPVHMGPARDIRVNLGHPGPLYWAANHGYGPASPPSTPVYHGGAQPVGVTALGTVAPPLRPTQGSGTNMPNQPFGGYGQAPYRGSSPPRRA
jgi:hypothetical protein